MRGRAILLLLLLMAPAAFAQDRTGSYSAADFKRIWAAIKDQCNQLSIAEAGGKELYDKCIAYQKSEWKIWAGFYSDPSVPWLVWMQCRTQSGFDRTLSIHDYNACIRLAKDRPDLQDNAPQ